MNTNPLFINLDGDYTNTMFEHSIQFKDIKTLHLDERADKEAYFLIKGNERESIIQLITMMLQRDYLSPKEIEDLLMENDYYYVGSKKESSRLLYHFILEDMSDNAQNLYMISEYNNCLTSIIHVEEYSNLPFSDTRNQRLVSITKHHCKITRKSISADTMSDRKADASFVQYKLYMKNGQITRFRYFVKRNSGAIY